MNKSIISGETMEEMKAKFLKHQQIYKTNYELAETEIKRMDELYQDLIETVLKVRYGAILILIIGTVRWFEFFSISDFE